MDVGVWKAHEEFLQSNSNRKKLCSSVPESVTIITLHKKISHVPYITSSSAFSRAFQRSFAFVWKCIHMWYAVVFILY